jgi:hypothetical protein
MSDEQPEGAEQQEQAPPKNILKAE